MSRAFIPAKESNADNETEHQVRMVLYDIRISESQLNKFRSETAKDITLQHVNDIINKGWPEKNRHLKQ